MERVPTRPMLANRTAPRQATSKRSHGPKGPTRRARSPPKTSRQSTTKARHGGNKTARTPALPRPRSTEKDSPTCQALATLKPGHEVSEEIIDAYLALLEARTMKGTPPFPVAFPCAFFRALDKGAKLDDSGRLRGLRPEQISKIFVPVITPGRRYLAVLEPGKQRLLNVDRRSGTHARQNGLLMDYWGTILRGLGHPWAPRNWIARELLHPLHSPQEMDEGIVICAAADMLAKGMPVKVTPRDILGYRLLIQEELLLERAPVAKRLTITDESPPAEEEAIPRITPPPRALSPLPPSPGEITAPGDEDILDLFPAEEGGEIHGVEVLSITCEGEEAMVEGTEPTPTAETLPSPSRAPCPKGTPPREPAIAADPVRPTRATRRKRRFRERGEDGQTRRIWLTPKPTSVN